MPNIRLCTPRTGRVWFIIFFGYTVTLALQGVWHLVFVMGNNSNVSLEEDTAERASRQVQVYVLLTLSILAILANTCIITALCRKRYKAKSFSNINFLILQLAVSDILVAAFCLLADGVWKFTYQWLAGDFMCKFVKYIQMFALYTSTFIIVTIGLDRCIAIRFAISRYEHHRIVRYLSLVAWILAGLCSVPQVGCYHNILNYASFEGLVPKRSLHLNVFMVDDDSTVKAAYYHFCENGEWENAKRGPDQLEN